MDDDNGDLLSAMIECCDKTYDLNPHLGEQNDKAIEKRQLSSRERQKRYRLAHPERIKARSAISRLRNNTSDSEELEGVIKEIYKSQNGKCWWCGLNVENDYHVDHRVPLAKGGDNHHGNLVVSCASCNLSKGDKLPHEWSDRLL